MSQKSNADDSKVDRENLIGSLEDFADLDRTSSEWRGENPRVARSYDEDLAIFFQTYRADHFSTVGCSELGFGPEQCEALARFVRLLSRFDERIRRGSVVSSEVVLSDPEWRTISAAARQTLELLTQDKTG